MYKEEFLFHAKHPRNKGVFEGATIVSRRSNPACGDTFTLYATVEDGKLTKVMFEGQGCVLSTAAASIVTEQVAGQGIVEVSGLGAKDMLKYLEADIGPMRMGCVTLALQALQRGIHVWQQDSKSKI